MRPDEHNLNSLRKLVRDLQEENKSLKKLLDENNIIYESESLFDDTSFSDEYDDDQGARIISFEPTEKLAQEFYSYFWGRMDVYAKRGKNGGYFPQCASRWDNPSCPKVSDPKRFCDEDCEYKSWNKLELWMIVQHLKGKKEDCSDVIGIYPLFPDNTCRFLVFDFDNHEKDSYKNDDANTDDLWMSEVDSLRQICKINNIDALVERSRSGKGAHVWLFFKGPIQAQAARAFGFALLDRGAASVNLPSFKYYDRMYPSQDVLSRLGNLVALPLQGRALKHGNSAFVDETWNAYPDQWAKLKSMKRISLEDINSFMQKWSEEAKRDYVITKYAEKNTFTRPWKNDDKFHLDDVIGGELHVILEDGVYVDTLNLMPRMQNQIKSLATIDNPQFYLNARVGRSNYYNLRTISIWSENEGYIKVPRGMLEKINDKCIEQDIKLDILDNRNFGKPIRVSFKGELKDQQELAKQQLEKFENGVLCAPTGFGKTVLAAYMIAQRKVSTLILLQNTELLPQWLAEFEKFLEIDEKPPIYYTKTGREKRRDGVIGTLTGGVDKTTGIIDFALIGSAYHKGEYFPNIDSYGMVLVDECHHVASMQGQAVMQKVKAKYVYGLSATPIRSDKLDDIIYMHIGPVRHKYTVMEQSVKQGLECLVIPRFTRVVNISGKNIEIYEADDLIADSKVRNDQIIDDVEQAVINGRTPLVLTKLKRHAVYLRDQLIGKADHVFLIYGDQSQKENNEIRKAMLRVPDNESVVLVATGQKVGEGFNFPRLNTLMLAAPIKFEGRLTQYVGRINREYEGKTDVIVYDYVDTHISFYDRQYRSRLTTYKKLGYKIISNINNKKQTANAIYDRRDYIEVFERDLVEADIEIVISSPGLRRGRVERLIQLMKDRQEEGVTVTVITTNPDQIGYEDTIELYILIDDMKKNGIYVRLTDEESEHFAVIDKKLVWHGGMNLLGKADAWDNLIRVESEQAASELLVMAEKDVGK